MTGLFLFSAILMVELLFFIVQYKSDVFHHRLKRNSRIFLLVLLGVLLVLQVLHWSFRYYGFVFLLLLFLIVSSVKVYNQSEDDKKKSGLMKLLGTLTLFGLSLVPMMLFPEYDPLETTGDYSIGMSEYTIIDTNRIETFNDDYEFRRVHLKSWFPTNTDQRFPLVIYSHGGISVDTSNESLCIELASHGYVVVSVSHPYHSLWTTDDTGKRIWIDSGYMKELQNENARENPEESFELYKKWMKIRTDDIHFVIDYIQAKVEMDSQESMYQWIDFDNIGVMGHSLGGSAALGIGRTREDVKAVIALESPFMCDILGVENGEFLMDETNYPIPVLNIYSDSSWENLSVWPQYAQNYRLLSNLDDSVYNEYISGVGHFSLTDLSLTSPFFTAMFNGFKMTKDPKEVLGTINEYSLDFLNSYLKGHSD